MTIERVRRHRETPITGWRTWHLSDDLAEPRLMPTGSGGTAVWEPRQPMEARCSVSPLLTRFRRHAAPDPSCTCGIYASRSLDVFDRPRPAWPPPTVVGTVSLWGTVIEHERGWRALFAYPARLRLVCPMCAWFEPGPGAPVAVHTFAGCAYALCRIHRGGIQVPDGRRTRPTDVDPTVLQALLLDAYAVDLLPIEPVEPLLLRARTPDPPANIPTIRVVPPEPA